MTAAIRFGLIGCGRIGAKSEEAIRAWPVADQWLPYTHASAIMATPGAELACICDINAKAAEQAALHHGVGALYTDFREMLAHERLDAVAIATRTSERPVVIELALAHGVRGFYCEKPLSNTLEDTDALARALANAGAVFVYGTKRRFMPAYQGVCERVKELGGLATVAVQYVRGPLFWTQPHGVDMASFFANDASIEYVQADLDLDPADVHGIVIDADPALRFAHIRYTNGVSAFLVPASGQDVTLSGPWGMAQLQADGYRTRWRHFRDDGSDAGWLLDEITEPSRSVPASGTQRSIAALVRALTDGIDPGYSIAHAVRNQEVLFAMVESHLAGSARVQFPLVRRGLRITGRTGQQLA